jgi:hypothetical protein
MILLRGESEKKFRQVFSSVVAGRYDLVDCLFDYRNAITIHGDDVLAHSNWELDEKWLRQYGYVQNLFASYCFSVSQNFIASLLIKQP